MAMIWPWTKIAALERELQLDREELANWKAIAREWRKVAAEHMKPLTPPEPVQPIPARVPDDGMPPEVLRALRSRTVEGSTVWFSELDRARARLASGVEPEKVVEEIKRGAKWQWT